MAIGNGELMHECFSKYSRMGTEIMKYVNETDEDVKKMAWVWKEAQHNKRNIVNVKH